MTERGACCYRDCGCKRPNRYMASKVKPRSFDGNGFFSILSTSANTLDLFAPVGTGVVRRWPCARGGTKQLCGVRPGTRRPGRRLRLLQGAAPQNLFRAAPWPFKTAGSAFVRRATGAARRHPEPVGGGATVTPSTLSQLVVSSRRGPPASEAATFSQLNSFSQVRAPARGPIQSQRGRGH